MEETDFLGKLITGNYDHNFVNTLLENQANLSLEQIEMGYNYSKSKNKRQPSFGDIRWLHLLAYSDAENKSAFLEKFLRQRSGIAGDAILLFHHFDSDRSFALLKAIHVYDQSFQSLRATRSPFTDPHISSVNHRVTSKTFQKLYRQYQSDSLKDAPSSKQIEQIQDLLITPGEDVKNYSKKSHQRKEVIETGALTEVQADRLIQVLASFVIKDDLEVEEKVISRTLRDYFVDHYDEVPRLKYPKEVEQFIMLLDQISDEQFDRIMPELVEYAGFWTDQDILDVLLDRDPQLYFEIWSSVLKEAEHPLKTKKSSDRNVRQLVSQVPEALHAMATMAEDDPVKKDRLQKLCISLISSNHPQIQ